METFDRRYLLFQTAIFINHDQLQRNPAGTSPPDSFPEFFCKSFIHIPKRAKHNNLNSQFNEKQNSSASVLCQEPINDGLLAIYKSTATEECRFHSNTLGFTVYRLKPWNLITERATILQHITIVPAIWLFPWNGCQTVKDKAWNRMGPAFVSEELNVFKGTNSSYVWR